ncbi:hypothetical protein [Mucilaginibacter sp. R-33]|uniref:hypothetical protein n=1 Tax=Mucilaginibacter sp. R-33 TaxID=3416711 RepID=UPI003CE8A213
MEQFDLLREAADGMIGNMIAGKGDIRELAFNVDLGENGYRVYDQRKAVNGQQIRTTTGWEQIGG